MSSTPLLLYHHTQRGLLIAVVLVLAALIEGAAMLGWLLSDGPSLEWLVVVTALVLLFVVVYVLAGSLTVSVERQQIRIALGAGLVRRSIPVSKIVGCQPVQNSWWYGWGIRLTPHGWLWNVSGLDAVELTYDSGRHFRIGTDEPRLLCDAINEAIRAA